MARDLALLLPRFVLPRAPHMPKKTISGPGGTNLKPPSPARPPISLSFSLSLKSTVMMFMPEDHRMMAYAARQVAVDRRWKPNVELAPNCPRCDSSNTKFCYYNNYSLTQPRYFCKGCRRYWTKGGSLRNVPVGGGCRKNRRGKSVRISTDSAYISSTSSCSSSPSGLQHGNSLVPDSGLRPDLALDDMFDNFHNSDGPSSTLSSGGSNIDMAVMYARYLNQVPELPEEAEDSFGFIGSAAAEMSTSTPSADPSCQKAGQAADQGSMGFKTSNFGVLSSMGELGFAVEPGMSLESLLMPMESSEVLSGSRDVFSMNWALENPNFPWPAQEEHQEVLTPAGFGSGHLFQDPKTGDWSSMDHEY